MAAPSIYALLLLLLAAAPAGAQRPRLDVRLAVLSSSTLVEDILATPALRTRLGSGLGRAPTARAAPGPELSVGVSVPVRPRVRLGGLFGWQQSRLRVEDAGGSRDVQDLAVLNGQLEAEFTVRPPVAVSVGFGVLGYRSEAEGLFADGSDLSALARVGAGGSWAVAGHRLSLRAVLDAHRFGNPLLRATGGESGGVLRYGLQAGFVPGGAR